MSSGSDYYGSIDHAIANLHVGKAHGLEEGYAQGLSDGYRQGLAEGNEHGTNNAYTLANQTIRAQNAIIQQHIEDKERLKKELVRQRELIEKLSLRVEELERENKLLRNGGELRGLVTELKNANNSLQEKLTASEAQYREQLQKNRDMHWHNNRVLVCMNAVRRVLEEQVSTGDHDDVGRLGKSFEKHYNDFVDKAQKEGIIVDRPEADAFFASELPTTHKLILKLKDAAQQQRLEEEAYADDWVPSV